MPFDAEPHGKLIGAIADLQTEDLTEVLTRVSTAEDAKGLTAYCSINRDLAEDAAELLYSVACTASLAAYRREEPSRLVVGDIQEITDTLDQIRAELIRLRPSMIRSLRRSRQTVVYARAWATLVLALDAAGRDLPTIVMYAPVPQLTRDPQGDAQVAAEDHFNDCRPAYAAPAPSSPTFSISFLPEPVGPAFAPSLIDLLPANATA